MSEEEKQQSKEKKQTKKPEEQKTTDPEPQPPTESKEETVEPPQPEEKPEPEITEKTAKPEQGKTTPEPTTEQPPSKEKTPEPTEGEQQPKAQPKSVEETSTKTKETTPSEKPKTKPAEKPQKTEKQETPEQEKDEDFRYIVRIADADIDGEKRLMYGLSQIKGIGRHLAFLITKQTGIKPTMKMGNLTDPQIDKIKDVLSDIESIAPSWMLNHRKDMDTGEDTHIISAQIGLQLRDDINMMKMIRCYRGVRHELSLPVRGQRTRANNRRGLALGVSRKRQ